MSSSAVAVSLFSSVVQAAPPRLEESIRVFRPIVSRLVDAASHLPVAAGHLLGTMASL